MMGASDSFRQKKYNFFVLYLTHPHICRHTYCSNMARSGMNPKTLQYLMGHSEIGVTLNTYTHLGLDDATDELKRVQELEDARKEQEKLEGKKPVSQKMFRAI